MSCALAQTFIGDGVASLSNTLLSRIVAICCHAMGFTRPSIAWQKNGQKVDRNINFSLSPHL